MNLIKQAAVIAIFTVSALFAQIDNKNQITISASAEETVPADIVVFNLTLKADAAEPKTAFELHRQQEKNLLQLIQRFEIPDSNINYSLMRISRRAAYNNNPERFDTYQTVQIKLNSIKQYNDFQIRLLDGGIYNFGSNFSSTKIDDAKKIALNNALKKAQTDAEQIASQIGRELGEVLNVNYHTSPNVQTQDMMRMDAAKSSITEIPQQLSVQVQVNVVYDLKISK